MERRPSLELVKQSLTNLEASLELDSGLSQMNPSTFSRHIL
jgi:hypothetical protein